MSSRSSRTARAQVKGRVTRTVRIATTQADLNDMMANIAMSDEDERKGKGCKSVGEFKLGTGTVKLDHEGSRRIVRNARLSLYIPRFRSTL